MIRCDDGGSVWIWFKLASAPTKKITWRLDEYLFYAMACATEEQFRADSLNGGVIATMTSQDVSECQPCLSSRAQSMVAAS
jgi:hypothetical protein